METPENSVTEPLEVLDSRAYSYALNLLAAREYCSKDLKQRLHLRDYPNAVIDRVLSKLVGFGYLDDSRYAKLLIARESRRGKGQNYIISKLYSKGLSEYRVLISEVVCTESDAYEKAVGTFVQTQLELISHLKSDKLEFAKAKRRILGKLIRRGLGFQEAQSLIASHL